MTSRADSNLSIAIKHLPRAISILVMLTAAAVLVGWTFDISNLKTGLPGHVTMKPNTALGLILAGLSLLLAHSRASGRYQNPGLKLVEKSCAFVIALLGLLTGIEYLGGWDIGIDQLLFRVEDGALTAPGRMAPATTLNFLLTGGSLLLGEAEIRSRYHPGQWLILVVALNSLIAILGYAYGIEALYGMAPYASVSILTALAFFGLSMGVLCTQRTWGLISILLADSLGGVLARRLLIAALLIPFIDGWLRLRAERAGYFTTEFGVAIFATTNITFFTLLIWWTARSLDRSDSERKRNEKKFRLAVESAPNGIVMTNSDGLIVMVNAQTEKLFGYSREQLIGQHIESLVPERFRQQHRNHRTCFMQSPETRLMGAGQDLYGQRRDGSEFPVEIGLTPIKMLEGIFVLCAIVDITDRKRADERFRLVVEASPSALIRVDDQGCITLVNKQAEQLFGYDRSELLGRSVEMLVPEPDRAAHSGDRMAFFENPSTRKMGASRELFGLRKDGTTVPVEIGLNPLRTPEGLFVLASIIDITERKKVEAELRRSQEQLAGVISSAMDAIITVDGEQRIVLFNNAAEKMFLFPSEDAIGQALDRFIPDRFRAAHKEHIRDFGETNVTTRSMGALGGLYALRANGQEFPIEASISQIEFDKQKLFTVILRDVTARKQVEAALKEQAQILDLAPVFISEPVSQRLVFWNTGAELMYGWTAAEALGKVVYELLRTKFPEPRERIQATLFARGRWEGELVHTRSDGKQIIVASHWVLHRDDDGNPKAILEVNSDITNWRHAEEKLTRLATAVEQSGDSIVITDTDGNVQYVNPAFEQTTGYSSEEVIGKNTRFLKSGGASRDYYERLWTTITSGSQWTGHFTNRRKDGTLFEEEATISPVRDSAGKIVSYVAVKRDVTERMRVEEEIRLLNEELEQRVADRTAQLQAANKELEAFSYSVSHDLRAPLRHINGFSQALLEDYSKELDATGKAYLKEVRGASQEMAQLIDDVLQLARVTRGEMSSEKVSLSELADNVVEDLKKRNGRRDVRVEIEEGLYTRGDKRLLRIMLTNLLDNAWKFTSRCERAEIAFGRQRCCSESAYFVRDNGAGFNMAHANKLFGVFQRLHSGGEFEGTGIGLATVQRIVTRHGGRIWADAKVNEGATFYFVLPDFKEAENE